MRMAQIGGGERGGCGDGAMRCSVVRDRTEGDEEIHAEVHAPRFVGRRRDSLGATAEDTVGEVLGDLHDKHALSGANQKTQHVQNERNCL